MQAYVMAAAAVLVLAAGIGACADDGASGPERLAAPQFARFAEQDLDGVPDLIVDEKRLERSWKISDEEMSTCAVEEGGASPGVHRILRFTVTTPNVGDADVFVGDPLEHVAADDGTFEFATCHDHYHFRNYATYELVSVSTGAVVQAAKRGFCMVDVTRWSPGNISGKPLYDSCGTRSSSGFQGVSVGWADTYARELDGQFFVLDEPDAPVPPGEYIIRITVNPPFVCGSADAERPRDASGLCHMFVEADYGNNVGETRLTLEADKTRQSAGPGADVALSDDELLSITLKAGHPHGAPE